MMTQLKNIKHKIRQFLRIQLMPLLLVVIGFPITAHSAIILPVDRCFSMFIGLSPAYCLYPYYEEDYQQIMNIVLNDTNHMLPPYSVTMFLGFLSEYAPMMDDSFSVLEPLTPVTHYYLIRNDQDTVAVMKRFADGNNPENGFLFDENGLIFQSFDKDGNIIYTDTLSRVTEFDMATFPIMLYDLSISEYNNPTDYYKLRACEVYNEDVEVFEEIGEYQIHRGGLTAQIESTQKTKPSSGKMFYTAGVSIEFTPIDESSMNSYLEYCRVWRIHPDGSEILLNELEDASGGSDESAWSTDYSQLKVSYPGNNIYFRDIFMEQMINPGEEFKIKYLIRGYNRVTDYRSIISPVQETRYFEKPWQRTINYEILDIELTVTYNDGTITNVEEVVASSAEKTTYYNVMGVASDKPFDGINIVVKRDSHGNVNTVKQIF